MSYKSVFKPQGKPNHGKIQHCLALHIPHPHIPSPSTHNSSPLTTHHSHRLVKLKAMEGENKSLKKTSTALQKQLDQVRKEDQHVEDQLEAKVHQGWLHALNYCMVESIAVHLTVM